MNTLASATAPADIDLYNRVVDMGVASASGGDVDEGEFQKALREYHLAELARLDATEPNAKSMPLHREDESGPDTPKPYLTARQVASLLGVGPRWVMDKQRQGALPSHSLPGSNRVRFLESEVRQALGRHKRRTRKALHATVEAV